MSDRKRVNEVNRKFKIISDAVKEAYGDDHPSAIVYTTDGVIMMGSPLRLAMIYKECDRHALEQLKGLKKDMAQEALDLAMSGHADELLEDLEALTDDDNDNDATVIEVCNNPRCPKHGKK